MVQLSRRFHFKSKIHIAVLQPLCRRNDIGLGYSPFDRHYLGNHYCFLFLRVLRCFSSPGLLSFRNIPTSSVWVAPFGNLRIKRLFAPSRSLSQLVTSFIASESQGIHRSLLFTFFKIRLIKKSHLSNMSKNSSSAEALAKVDHVHNLKLFSKNESAVAEAMADSGGEYRSRTDDLLRARQAL